MNACDNIFALAQGGSASVADYSTFGVIDPPRPGGSSLDCIFTVQKPPIPGFLGTSQFHSHPVAAAG
jgi:hypothetical protein